MIIQLVMKGQWGKAFKDIIQRGSEVMDCGCQMGREGSQNESNKKKSDLQLTTPYKFLFYKKQTRFRCSK